MKKALAVFFIALAEFSFSQENALEHCNAVKFTPVRLIDFSNPGIELTYEKRLTERKAIQIGITYLYDILQYVADDIRSGFNGYRFSAEGKFYIKNHKKFGWYASAELVYLFSQYNKIADFRDTNNVFYDDDYNVIVYTDSIHVKKNTKAVNVKTGLQFYLRRFVFDVYVGIGVKHRYVKHFKRIDPEDELDYPVDFTIDHYSNMEQKRITFSAAAGFRVGVNF